MLSRGLSLALPALLALAASAWSRPAAALPPPGQRDFYAALDDTLGDFEFDLKHDAVKGTQNISVRDIVLNEGVPRSFTAHLEDLIVERILRATKSKVIQCIGCQARRTTLNGDKISMTSPRTNARELARIAKARGIEHFLDVTFTYQPTGLVMSMTVTNPADSTILWTRTYNSESSRAANLRRGIDMDQLDPSTRKATEYPAILQYRLRVDFLFEPDVSGETSCMGFAFQMVERYGNRKYEIGFESEYILPSSLLEGHSSSSSTTAYSPINLTLLVMHAWNLIGSEEDYNKARASLNGGIGGTFSGGFAGALFRFGGEWREARHFATGAFVGYRPKSSSFLPIGAGAQVSGLEVGAGISYLF